jgi:hypothetical protein
MIDDTSCEGSTSGAIPTGSSARVTEPGTPG